jgi:hypothetical protein
MCYSWVSEIAVEDSLVGFLFPAQAWIFIVATIGTRPVSNDIGTQSCLYIRKACGAFEIATLSYNIAWAQGQWYIYH